MAQRKTIDAAAEAAEELDFSTVLASTVHDMKNALTLMLSTLDNIIDDIDAGARPARATYLRARQEGRRVNTDLIQLLALYRIGKAQYHPDMQEHALGEFLEEIVLEEQDVARLKGLALSAAAPDDLFWYFDRELVGGVLHSIIDNACRHARGAIRLAAAQQDDALILSVADDGPGYPQELIDPQQAHQRQLSFKSGSTGLGLYFARVVARLHQHHGRSGCVRLDNPAPGGGRFMLVLP
jgi:K+-sensing histidine kinase KdpD